MGNINTVLGPIDSSELGVTISHEHIATGSAGMHRTYPQFFDREAVIARMAEAGIETTIGTYGCHQHPAYATWCHGSVGFPNSELFANQSLTLPLVPNMTTGQVERVVDALVGVLEGLLA